MSKDNTDKVEKILGKGIEVNQYQEDKLLLKNWSVDDFCGSVASGCYECGFNDFKATGMIKELLEAQERVTRVEVGQEASDDFLYAARSIKLGIDEKTGMYVVDVRSAGNLLLRLASKYNANYNQ